MSISDHHSIEIEFEKEFIWIRRRVESFEKKFREGEDKYGLLLGLKDLRDRIYDIQVHKFGHYLEIDTKTPYMSQEGELKTEIIDLNNRIDSMIKEV